MPAHASAPAHSDSLSCHILDIRPLKSPEALFPSNAGSPATTLSSLDLNLSYCFIAVQNRVLSTLFSLKIKNLGTKARLIRLREEPSRLFHRSLTFSLTFILGQYKLVQFRSPCQSTFHSAYLRRLVRPNRKPCGMAKFLNLGTKRRIKGIPFLAKKFFRK